MSILHVNQISGAMHRVFDGLIDLSEAPRDEGQKEKLFLSRALAAFALTQLAGCTPDEAAGAITDGTGDNGIDAAYFDRSTKTMYVVQSKWYGDGNGSFDRADILKLTNGFEDLANLAFDRFNAKMKSREADISEAFYDDQARYLIVCIHTGTQGLAAEPQQDLDDCLREYNDTADDQAENLLEARILKQADVYALLAKGTQGRPINLDVALFQWGEAKEPYAVYGQVAASDVAAWWKAHYPQILSQNLRHFLGSDTEVNAGLQATLLNEPEHFWHYNNGVTAICREIRPKGLGGKSKEAGLFVCEDVRIVNGAQTAGSIATAEDRNPKSVEKARVQIRFIAVGEDAKPELAEAITRATNTQNRVNRQDFVALDPDQQRLRTELIIDGITYNFKSGVGTVRDSRSFDLEEATVALACASADLSHSTLAKREIGRLWEDPKKPPYRALFNPSVSAAKLWRLVQVMRLIDRALAEKRAKLAGREKGLAVHGNRFISYLAFRKMPASLTDPSQPLAGNAREIIASQVDEAFGTMPTQVQRLFPQSYAATLFKNQKKLARIAKAILEPNPTA